MEVAGLRDAVRFAHLPEDRLHELLLDGDRPTAVLCYCHVEAMAVYLFAWRHGLRIPQDLSVIGFNELQTVRYMTPPLTTMGFNTRHIGRAGARLLVRQIEGGGEDEPERVVVTPRLIERQSTAPPGQAGRLQFDGATGS
jgi:DNA-binding LacI/PurR family transcriptional regulator